MLKAAHNPVDYRTPSERRAIALPGGSIVTHAALCVAATISLAPFLWLLCASVKRGEDLFTYTFLPWRHLNTLTLDNFRSLFTRQAFGNWLLNSIFIASTQTAVVVTLSSLGGFALAKYQFRFKKPLMIVMLGTMLLPSHVLLGSSYELMNILGWMNTYWAILVPGAVSVFGMFLFRQAM